MRRPWGQRSALSGASYSAAELSELGDVVWLLDQRRLPEEEAYEALRSVDAVAAAIRDMVVRGAPAIGIAAAYGLALAARAGDDLQAAGALLSASRPTAVNLRWAVERMLRVLLGAPAELRAGLAADEARALHREDVAACRAMGARGAEHLPQEGTVLTHCNAGALATGGYGTALGVIRAARERGKRISVLADETRPYLQGARLTAWELHRDGVPVTVLTDGMAAHLMRTTKIAAVIVGADRVAQNGDVANKIGTYGLACLAEKHGVPFFVAAPESTLDRGTATGDGIPIEERGRDEVAIVGGRTVVPDGVAVRHPAFDVTPAALVTALFTEKATYRGALS